MADETEYEKPILAMTNQTGGIVRLGAQWLGGFNAEELRGKLEEMIKLVLKARAERDLTLFCLHGRDFGDVGLRWPDDGIGCCTETNLNRFEAAKRLKKEGLVTIEDSPRGPIVRWAQGRGLDPKMIA